MMLDRLYLKPHDVITAYYAGYPDEPILAVVCWLNSMYPYMAQVIHYDDDGSPVISLITREMDGEYRLDNCCVSAADIPSAERFLHTLEKVTAQLRKGYELPIAMGRCPDLPRNKIVSVSFKGQTYPAAVSSFDIDNHILELVFCYSANLLLVGYTREQSAQGHFIVEPNGAQTMDPSGLAFGLDDCVAALNEAIKSPQIL